MDLGFLSGAASDAAPRLLGCVIERELEGRTIRVRIVETEAYDQSDTASHSYRGRTPRTDVMFGPPGHLYVYFTYGIHYCCNVVTGGEGHGAAALIRAVEPLEGADVMIARRGGKAGPDLTNGPAKLCEALGIARQMNGHDLSEIPLRLVPMPALPGTAITVTTRIGISTARDVPWRFYETNNPYVSKK